MATNTYFCFWKVERPDATWHRIDDTPEDRAHATRSGAMFITTPSLSHEPGPGLPEPTRRGDLILDADNKANPPHALDDIRRLCCFHLPETYGISPWDIRFFCSGSKGFHAEIPARFFGLEDGHPELPLVYKRLVRGWADELGLTTLDLSVYNMGRGRMWRLPNVRRSNGRMKVPLTRDDVGFCSYDDLWALSEAPGVA